MQELDILHMTIGEHFMSFLVLSCSSKEHFIHNLQFLFISKAYIVPYMASIGGCLSLCVRIQLVIYSPLQLVHN